MKHWTAANAALALEDGRIFYGRSFGAPGTRTGEVVFNTAMTGYQEIYSDPSYSGQIVTLTYPLVGNYGANDDDFESRVDSRAFHAEAVVVREHCERPSSWRAQGRLGDWLEERGVVGISEIDTRALTRHIRSAGELRAVVSTEDLDERRLVARARAASGLWAKTLQVSSARGPRGRSPRRTRLRHGVRLRGEARHPARARGARVRRRRGPAHTPAAEVLARRPVGVVLSNGPATRPRCPARARMSASCSATCRCWPLPGHQIAGLALGAQTKKLKFGHHGANHPVLEVATGRISVTSQNHGFVVDESTLPPGVRVSHRSLNDGAVEGIAHDGLALVSVQYHPEASPGPHDSAYLFDRFADLTETRPAALHR